MADESWQAAVQRHLFSALVLGMLLASFGRVLGTFGIEKTRRLPATMLPQSGPDGDPWGPKVTKIRPKMEPKGISKSPMSGQKEVLGGLL